MAPVVKETRGRKRKVPEDADDLSPHPTTLVTPGAVFVWGEGDCGQLGTGPDLQGNYRPVPLASLAKNVVQVKCGGMHSCALLQDGTVFTWGVNDECALGRETDDDGSTVPGKVVGIDAQGGNKVVQVMIIIIVIIINLLMPVH
jgi:regulator of chromosome condensation